MRQLYYNRQRNDGLKNIVLGTINAVVSWSLLLFIRIADKESLNLYRELFILLFFIVAGYLLTRIPFGQVFESFDQKKFRTYYKLGPFKFQRKEWGQADEVLLKQDKEKFYWIVIKTVNGQILEVDKCPTLKQSEERISEYRKLFD